ncbi:hypothetical protein NF552_12045 [Roseomonas mucosa]|nr:hypothetical protein NF552_12045 [Roseomonas mucosa]
MAIVLLHRSRLFFVIFEVSFWRRETFDLDLFGIKCFDDRWAFQHCGGQLLPTPEIAHIDTDLQPPPIKYEEERVYDTKIVTLEVSASRGDSAFDLPKNVSNLRSANARIGGYSSSLSMICSGLYTPPIDRRTVVANQASHSYVRARSSEPIGGSHCFSGAVSAK